MCGYYISRPPKLLVIGVEHIRDIRRSIYSRISSRGTFICQGDVPLTVFLVQSLSWSGLVRNVLKTLSLLEFTSPLSNPPDLIPLERDFTVLMHVSRAMSKSIRAGLLPAALFQNGHTFFVQQTAQALGNQPYAVHASYVPGKFKKVHHFREALLWHVRSCHSP